MAKDVDVILALDPSTVPGLPEALAAATAASNKYAMIGPSPEEAEANIAAFAPRFSRYLDGDGRQP